MSTMSVGTYKTEKHISIEGTPTSFYVWNRQGRQQGLFHSNWIVGRDAFEAYNKLRKLYEKANKKEFVDFAIQLWETHKRID